MTTQRIRHVLWADMAPIHAAVLEHPFLRGLVDGSLPRDAFAHYIVQDALYLRGYSKALAACAAKAPDEDATLMFAEHAAGAIAAERSLHADLLSGLGASLADADRQPPAPATQAYLSYLRATTLGGSYPEAVGAVLPCYWIYAKVGEALVDAGSPDPLYARWIAMYGGEEFQTVVDAVLAEVDRMGATLSDAELARVRAHVTTTSRYEWMFWDGAWRRERWPV